MKAELDKCRENESTWRQRLEQRDGQICQMRSELEAEQKTISALEVEVKELQSKLHKDDASFRNEVFIQIHQRKKNFQLTSLVDYSLVGDQVAVAAQHLYGAIKRTRVAQLSTAGTDRRTPKHHFVTTEELGQRRLPERDASG